jgi:hypothetical protein
MSPGFPKDASRFSMVPMVPFCIRNGSLNETVQSSKARRLSLKRSQSKAQSEVSQQREPPTDHLFAHDIGIKDPCDVQEGLPKWKVSCLKAAHTSIM